MTALGQYQFNDIWLVTFKTLDAQASLLNRKILVKGMRCLVLEAIDPAIQLKLNWVPCAVTDSDIREAFADYGTADSVSRETWFDPELGTLRLRPGW